MMGGALALAVATTAPAHVMAQAKQPLKQTGVIEWSLWIDPDGCMHWWADGGLEGYMVPRRDPRTGKPVCLKQKTCLDEGTDALFATNSSDLTTAGRDRLRTFFRGRNDFGYAIYGHTDSRASDAYNLALSQRRAKAVADVARAAGAVVEKQVGYGERRPVATNATAEGQRRNRRVEVVCYKK